MDDPGPDRRWRERGRPDGHGRVAGSPDDAARPAAPTTRVVAAMRARTGLSALRLSCRLATLAVLALAALALAVPESGAGAWRRT